MRLVYQHVISVPFQLSSMKMFSREFCLTNQNMLKPSKPYSKKSQNGCTIGDIAWARTSSLFLLALEVAPQKLGRMPDVIPFTSTAYLHDILLYCIRVRSC